MARTVHVAVGDVDRCELRALFHSARHVVKLWHLFFPMIFYANNFYAEVKPSQ
jgi:hypothetical protein